MGLKSDHHGLSTRFLKGGNLKGTPTCLHLLQTLQASFYYLPPTTYPKEKKKKRSIKHTSPCTILHGNTFHHVK